jgi:hypothetical protein
MHGAITMVGRGVLEAQTRLWAAKDASGNRLDLLTIKEDTIA